VAQTLSNESGVKIEFTWAVDARKDRVIVTRQARSVNTMPISEPSKKWIDSILGAFDDQPIYARIMENAKAYRRELEEQIAAPEEREIVHPR
jgi:hypothetical protein